MRFHFVIILCLLQTAMQAQHIIPQPQNIAAADCVIDLNQSSFMVQANEGLGRFIEGFLRVDVLGKFSQPKKSTISTKIFLIKDQNFKNAEAYQLTIKEGQIEIKGSEQGIFYGLQTLRQLIFQTGGKLQCQTIIDSAAFKWRGMHLDVSRHFFNVEFIKKYIDILALHKMNTFHWHLTDDQGWRIEIKKYPLLTKISSQRSETIIEKNFSPYKGDGKAYGGFYTQEEIKEVVQYAQERFITVVPEIEMPGHAVAALGAYPQYSCRQQPLQTLTQWGISDDVFCTTDSTFNFVFDILEEVLALFPSKYIHIGGDEVPKTRWKACANCQKLIADKNLKDEHGLQSYFIGRVDSFLTAKGRNTIGWDEILEGGLAKNAAVMSWRGEQGGIDAAKQKHHVVMSPGSHCYFDHYQGNKKSEPLAIGGYTSVRKVHSYNPIPNVLSHEEANYILGAQGNVWTEYIETPEHVMYMALPRLSALSEVLWSGKNKPSYENFSQRLIKHFDLLEALKINYAKSIYDINATSMGAAEGINLKLNSDLTGYEIRYETDGAEPNANSSLYKEPISVLKNTIFHAGLFDKDKKMGNTFRQGYVISPSTGKPYKLAIDPSNSYSTNKLSILTDGVVGSLPWSGNEWLGWNVEHMEVDFDFEKITKLNTIKISFLEAKESWIWMPKQVFILTSDDGKKYKQLATIEIDTIEKKSTLVEMELNTNARYIKIQAMPPLSIPEGNAGAGETPWLFCSEIIIE